MPVCVTVGSLGSLGSRGEEGQGWRAMLAVAHTRQRTFAWAGNIRYSPFCTTGLWSRVVLDAVQRGESRKQRIFQSEEKREAEPDDRKKWIPLLFGREEKLSRGRFPSHTANREASRGAAWWCTNPRNKHLYVSITQWNCAYGGWSP